MPESVTAKVTRPSGLSDATRSNRELHHSLFGEFRGVAQQIDQALLELHDVDTHHADIGRHVDLQAVGILVHQRRNQNAHFGHKLAEIDILQMNVHAAGLDLGEIEDVVDQTEQMLAGALDLDEIGLAGVVAAIGASSCRISL